MKKINFLLVLIVSLSAACNKADRDNLGLVIKGPDPKEQYIRGRVFMADTIISQTHSEPMPNLEVKLSLVNPTTDIAQNFLYSTTTDAQGYFTFQLQPGLSDEYFVFANLVKEGRTYFGAEAVNISETIVTINMYLDQNKINGFIVEVSDLSGGKIPTCKVKLYSSKFLSQNDSLGVVKEYTSNTAGIISDFDIAPGTYYLNSSIKITHTLTLKAQGIEITVPKKGIEYGKIVLY